MEVGYPSASLRGTREADWLIGGAQLGYVVTTPNHVVRDWNVYGSVASGWTFGGQRRATGMGFNSEIDFASNWIVVAQLNQSLPALSVDALRGGPALRTPAATTGWVWVSTDQRRRAYVTLLTDFSHEPESGAKELGLNPVVDVRPSGRMELSVGPYVSWAVNPWQYVAQQTALGAPHYVVGRVAQTTASTGRAKPSTPTRSSRLRTTCSRMARPVD